MLHLLATAFLFAPAIDDPIPAEPTASDELTALAAELAAAENYTFTSLSASDGGGFGGGFGGFGGGRGRDGGGGRGEGGEGGEGGEDDEAPERPAPTPVTGHYVAGNPLHLVQDEAEGYREGETFVYRTEAEGEWLVMETGGGRGGFGGGRGERGERGGGGGREGMRAAMGLMRATAPAASFADFSDKIDAEALQVSVVEATETDSGKTTFSGPLTSEGASAFSGSRFGFGRGGRGGGGDEGPQMETSGTFTIEAVDGAIVSAVFTVTTSGSFRDREFERTSTNTYTFSDIGETEHATPDDVIVHFEI